MWISNAANAVFKLFGGDLSMIPEIENVIRAEYEKEFPPAAPVVPFKILPNPTCRHCGGSSVRNSSMHPNMWTCNDCGKHTEQ